MEGSRTIYHRETKMIHAKSNKGYVWDNRKRAQKPKSVKEQTKVTIHKE